MTLADLLAALYNDLGYEAAPAPTVTARLTRYVNEGYRLVLSMPEMSPLRSGTLDITSSPNRTTYGFSSAFVSIDQMVDTTNNIRLRLMTQDQFRTIDPQEVSSGTPTHYVPLGYGPTVRPPGPTPLWVASTDAADTTQVLSFTVTASSAFQVGMRYPPQTVTLNGLTPVQLGPPTANIYDHVLDWHLLSSAAGIVTLADTNSVSTPDQILGRIPPRQLSVQYQQIQLWPTPAGAYRYRVDGIVVITDLETTTDIPILPADFQYMLTDYARWREYEYRDDSRGQLARAQFQEKLKYLRDRIIDPPDYRPRVGRIPDRSSNLGSYFPPGRW